MYRPARRRSRGLVKTIVSLTFLVLILGACSSDGFPVSYTDQIDSETGRSNVEQNWLDGCMVGLGQSDNAADANTVCECSFAAIRGNNGIPFEDFVSLDKDLSGDPGSLTNSESLTETEARLLDIVKGCIAGS